MEKNKNPAADQPPDIEILPDSTVNLARWDRNSYNLRAAAELANEVRARLLRAIPPERIVEWIVSMVDHAIKAPGANSVNTFRAVIPYMIGVPIPFDHQYRRDELELIADELQQKNNTMAEDDGSTDDQRSDTD